MSSVIAAESGEGAILPTWTHVDGVNVRTSRELWEQMRADGWNVEVRFWIFISILISNLVLCPLHSSIIGLLMNIGDGIMSLIHCFSIPISPDRPIEVNTLYFRIEICYSFRPGQLLRRVPTCYQKHGPSAKCPCIFLWHGCRSDHFCHGRCCHR